MRIHSSDGALAGAVSAIPHTEPSFGQGSFVSLLRDQSSSVVSAQRGPSQEAAGLGSLGVFGRFGAIASSTVPVASGARDDTDAAPVSSAIASSEKAEAQNGKAFPVFGSRGIEAGPLEQDSFSAGSLSGDLASSQSDILPVGAATYLPTNLTLPALDAAAANIAAADQKTSIKQADELPEPEQAASVDAARQEATSEEGNSDLSVVVAGSNDALNVMVNGSSLEKPSLLQDVVDSTAAEFGVRVSGFYINGAKATAPMTASGGPNGNYTR